MKMESTQAPFRRRGGGETEEKLDEDSSQNIPEVVKPRGLGKSLGFKFLRFLAIVLLCLASIFLLAFGDSHYRRALQRNAFRSESKMGVVFTPQSVIQPKYRLIDDSSKDFGELKISMLRENRTRAINKQDYQKYNILRRKALRIADEKTTYDDIDDDPQRFEPFDELGPSEDGCYRLKWTYGMAAYSTCNEFHSLDLRGMATNEGGQGIDFLGYGSFRETWMLDLPPRDRKRSVLKTNR